MHSDEDGKFSKRPIDETDQNTLLEVLSVVEDVAYELEDGNSPERDHFADELKQAIIALRRGLAE